LKTLAGLWRKPTPVADNAALRAFLASESAFLAQKTTVEYCRARSGFFWQKLFGEAGFRDALDVCRWGAMAAVLADQVIVTEGFLRRHADGQEAALGAALIALFEDILRGYAADVLPEQRAGWDDLTAELPARMARAQLGEPHGPAEIARASGGLVYDLLPIHKSLRGHDREMMMNAVRFGMVGFHRKLEEVVRDPAALARDVIARSA
jgi:hypothetical protein